jgi:DNA-binding MarR family transcriptional regulator
MQGTPGYECVIQILQTANVIWKKSRQFFEPFGVTEAQFNILHLLSQKPEGMSQTELSKLLVVDRSNVTLLLDRMEKKGWTRRHEVPHDRRAYRINLSSSGHTLWKRILPHYLKTVEEVVQTISKHDLHACLKVLEQIEKRTNVLVSNR